MLRTFTFVYTNRCCPNGHHRYTHLSVAHSHCSSSPATPGAQPFVRYASLCAPDTTGNAMHLTSHPVWRTRCRTLRRLSSFKPVLVCEPPNAHAPECSN